MKFYKITNKEEVHNGMNYKTGLNIDVLPFCPEGSCDPGGIYFSREDILVFMDHGCWLREVSLPEGEPVYKDPWNLKKWKAHRVILGKRRLLTPEVIEELIKEGADVNTGGGYPLRHASKKGDLKIVEVLLKNGANAHALALRVAAENGHLPVLKLLVKNGANISDEVLWQATVNGHLPVVKFLIKNGANVHFNKNVALYLAATNGHLPVVKFLLKNGADGEAAIQWLGKNNYPNAAKNLKKIMEELK